MKKDVKIEPKKPINLLNVFFPPVTQKNEFQIQ